jgi:2-polyprenyl-6-methoxyphenol hydroxylase-like FAD-dependent oxidoreductase
VTRRRLVVAGGGLGGLLAAAAAAPEFEDVLVVEQRLAAGDSVAAPQAAQLHNVLTRGQRHLDELLPGFRAHLLGAGGQEGSVADDTHVFEFGGAGTERPLGLSIWSAPWALLWSTARTLLPDQVRVTTGELDAVSVHGGAVQAVTVTTREGRAQLAVDGLVDATGYSSRAVELLAEAGAPAPEATERQLDRWFVTVRLIRPPEWSGARDFWMTFTEPPERDVALLSPAGPDRWILSVSSQAGGPPPRDHSEIGDFLDRLPGPPLRPLLDAAAAASELSYYRRRTARWHRYETLSSPVEGFIPLGDAFASINPVYGQGVGVAAWQASLLGDALRTETPDRSWTRRYLAAAGAAVAQAWSLDDIPVPFLSTPTWIALAARLATDAELQRRYVGLWHLVEPTSTLRELADQVALELPTGGDDDGGHATDGR